MRTLPLLLSLALVPALAAPAADIDSILKSRQSPGATVRALVKAMAESPEDPSVPRAFTWLVNNGGVSEETDFDMDEAFLKRIEKYHRDDDQLAGALMALVGCREEAAIAFFDRLGEESKSELVSGTALLTLASSFEHDSDNIERYDAALKKLLKKHPTLKHGRRDIAGYAKQKLFASQHLRIGKVAPEVEGEDAEGKQFKLSDYRGKVVFFNFWGDW